jgi:hypothetical protein
MRTLICLLKQPSETYKAFNDRLADACAVMRPSGARCALVGTQPKVDLIALDDDDTPVRVAVCPLEAGNDAEAARTQDRLARVLAAAEGKPVFTADTEPPVVTICMWPLEAAAASDGPNGDDASSENAEDESSGDNEDIEEVVSTPTAASAAPHAPTEPAQASAGRPPFGFRRRGGRLEEDPDEADIVRTVLDAYDSGLTDDRIMGELMDAHGEWVREHWQPKEIPRHVRRIIEKADFYRRKLAPEVR